jgi:vacuolar protein sorting-associated protein 13A/C
MRKKYVEIYVQKLALTDAKPLPVEDATALTEMENTLSYEDIRFFRSVARAQAKKDAATRRKLEAEKAASQAPRQTWGQWIWGTGPSETSNGGMTEDQKKELDDIIDFDAEAAAQTVATPMDFMKARVAAKLNKGSFSLRVDPHGDSRDIISLVFDSFSADAVQLTESVSGKLALGGFRVFDGTTSNSLYPQIVRVKDLEGKKQGSSSSRQASLQAVGTEGVLAELSDDMDGNTDAVNDPFFVMEVDHNPLDGRADNALSVRMRHLEIIYHKGYVEAVVQFFRPPESQLESITALIDAAGQTLDGIRKETRAGLEYALDNHKTVDIKVDMNAPIIVIPME